MPKQWYRITREAVETYIVEAESLEDAYDKYMDGEAALEDETTMDIKTELKENP